MRKITLLAAVLIGMVAFLATSCRYVDDASDTAFKEFKPSAMLKKYSDFKDMSAALDQKLASLKVYEGRFTDLKEQYKDANGKPLPRKEWAREDREQYNLWQGEQAGIKASYNELASQYNANMVKFNYAFCNVGTLPKGATEPLPREYREYIDQ
jgi:hypothetical protein